MKEIPITDLMTPDVEPIAPETPIREVIHLMYSRRQSCAVIGRDRVPLGVITERDLVGLLDRSLDSPAACNCTAESIMSAPPHTLAENQSLFDALVISRAERVRHLPVVDAKQQLIGLVTYSNLAEAHFHVVERQQHEIERAVADRTEALRETNEELLRMSMEDGLLGIGNRRSMEVDVDHTHQLSERYQRTYSVVLLDIDHFKRYNDQYGHPAGDECLKKVANYLKASVRGVDRLYRYGGEEFLLLLPDTDFKGANKLSERLLKRLFEKGIPHETSPYRVVTVSAGIATCSGRQSGQDHLAGAGNPGGCVTLQGKIQRSQSGRLSQEAHRG